MKVSQAELVISAVSPKQYPQDALPEVALAGRSNVGKSSFINKMDMAMLESPRLRGQSGAR